MPLSQRIVVITVSLGIVALIFELVRKRRLREEYSWLWILAGAAIFLLAFVPFEALMVVANAVGSEKPTAVVYFFGFIFVTLVCLQFSVRLSRMTEQVKTLAQKIAILEEEKAKRA
jgi:hypothetical protein